MPQLIKPIRVHANATNPKPERRLYSSGRRLAKYYDTDSRKEDRNEGI